MLADGEILEGVAGDVFHVLSFLKATVVFIGVPLG